VARIKLGRALLNQGRFAEAARESLAGYGIIAKQASPSISWLDNARNDLVIEYDSLHMPDQAARFQSELAASPASSVPAATR
jgi:eukaryotic-like serine/threonine-protein kinase